jgi:hypothetical protein
MRTRGGFRIVRLVILGAVALLVTACYSGVRYVDQQGNELAVDADGKPVFPARHATSVHRLPAWAQRAVESQPRPLVVQPAAHVTESKTSRYPPAKPADPTPPPAGARSGFPAYPADLALPSPGKEEGAKGLAKPESSSALGDPPGS